MKVINFEEKKRQRQDRERYEYIKSMCQFQRQDLFDQLISEQVLTDDKIASCSDFIKALQKRKIDPLSIFEESVFVWEDDFYDEWNINWYIAIEEALVYYAVNRRHDREAYNISLQLHPYIAHSID